MTGSLFITGTDTDVGKTYVAAGLAASFRNMGIDVGIMKPFAAGDAQKGRYASKDVAMLSNAAGTKDAEGLVNPQFFPIPASPYTACKSLKSKPRLDIVLSSFEKLQELHDMIIVEGIGGLMTPIHKEYFVADLIKEMNIPAIIVTKSRIGTINHTIMTCQSCKKFKIPVRGIIINSFGGGYPASDLAEDLLDLTGVEILGTVPRIKNMGNDSLCRIFQKNINLERLAGSSRHP